MKLNKILVAAVASIAISGISAMAYAKPLTIVNDSEFDSTSKINRGPCSTILGPNGVTKAGTKNEVPETTVNFACMANTKNCKADVYMTNDCKGPVVATAVFDTQKGIKEIKMTGHGFNITGNDFTVTISGKPAKNPA